MPQKAELVSKQKDKKKQAVTRAVEDNVPVSFMQAPGETHLPLTPATVVAIQQSVGNVAVQRLIAGQEGGAGVGEQRSIPRGTQPQIQRQPEQAPVAERINGIVKWFSDEKGYGYLTQPEGADVYVHSSAIQTYGPPTLREGQSAEYSIENGPKGPQATNVIPM